MMTHGPAPQRSLDASAPKGTSYMPSQAADAGVTLSITCRRWWPRMASIYTSFLSMWWLTQTWEIWWTTIQGVSGFRPYNESGSSDSWGDPLARRGLERVAEQLQGESTAQGSYVRKRCCGASTPWGYVRSSRSILATLCCYFVSKLWSCWWSMVASALSNTQRCLKNLGELQFGNCHWSPFSDPSLWCKWWTWIRDCLVLAVGRPRRFWRCDFQSLYRTWIDRKSTAVCPNKAPSGLGLTAIFSRQDSKSTRQHYVMHWEWASRQSLQMLHFVQRAMTRSMTISPRHAVSWNQGISACTWARTLPAEAISSFLFSSRIQAIGRSLRYIVPSGKKIYIYIHIHVW